MKTELVPFQGQHIEGLLHDGKPWAVVKWICENLGLDYPTQYTKLSSLEWATVGIIPMVAADGRQRDLFCVDLESLPMWLVTIHATKVREEVRPVLLAYQRQCKQVLADHFLGRAPQPDLRQIIREEVSAILRSQEPGHLYTAEAWAAHIGVSRPTAHRWREAHGLSGELTREEWTRITPKKYLGQEPCGYRTVMEEAPPPAPAELADLLAAELRQHPHGLTTEHLAELVDASEADILLCLRAHRERFIPGSQGRLLRWRVAEQRPLPTQVPAVRAALERIQGEVTTRRVLETMGLPVTRGNECMVGQALLALGLRKHRVGSRPRHYVYTRPN